MGISSNSIVFEIKANNAGNGYEYININIRNDVDFNLCSHFNFKYPNRVTEEKSVEMGDFVLKYEIRNCCVSGVYITKAEKNKNYCRFHEKPLCTRDNILRNVSR